MADILVADDHAVVRHGLRQIISGDPGLRVVGEATNGEEVLRLAQELRPDVVLLDISMPGKSGLEVLTELRRKWPRLPVLILSMHPEDQLAIRLLKAGAAGYVTKESAPEELIGALKKVCAGGKYVGPLLAERLAAYVGDDSGKPAHESLSAREFQVLCMIAQGKTVSQISDELNLSAKTVSTYRVRILDKMKMKTSAELTLYAVRNNLVH
jgi:DNA-binding NarL/FixJ family response regulator